MTAAEAVGTSDATAHRPIVSADPRRFEVDTAGHGTLVATRCTGCDTVVFGTHRACLACASVRVERTAVAGRGTVLSYSVIHRPSKDWWGSVPYTVAEVRTDDSVIVVAGVVDVPAEGTVDIGARVELRPVLVEHPDAAAWVAVFQWTPLRSEAGDRVEA
jgi:uncharacterized OB-fold protein